MRVLHHMPVIFFYVNFILNTQKQLGKHQRLLTFDEKRRHNVVTAFEYQAMMPKVVRRSKFPLYVRCVCVCVCVTGQHLALSPLRPPKIARGITIVFRMVLVQMSPATQATKLKIIRNFSRFLQINVTIKHRIGPLSLICWWTLPHLRRLS